MTSGGPQDILVCPETKLPVRQRTLDEAAHLTPDQSLVSGRSDGPRPVGPTSSVMLREDHQCAYPIVDGIPVLLAPEALVPPSRQRSFDLSDPRYAEAYAEMDFYNQVAEERAKDVAASKLIRCSRRCAMRHRRIADRSRSLGGLARRNLRPGGAVGRLQASWPG